MVLPVAHVGVALAVPVSVPLFVRPHQGAVGVFAGDLAASVRIETTVCPVPASLFVEALFPEQRAAVRRIGAQGADGQPFLEFPDRTILPVHDLIVPLSRPSRFPDRLRNQYVPEWVLAP